MLSPSSTCFFLVLSDKMSSNAISFEDLSFPFVGAYTYTVLLFTYLILILDHTLLIFMWSVSALSKEVVIVEWPGMEAYRYFFLDHVS